MALFSEQPECVYFVISQPLDTRQLSVIDNNPIVCYKRAIGYFRVSTVRQSGERHSSLETQLEHFKAYCQRNGLTPVKTFTDTVSGRRDDRKAYQEGVGFALSGEANVVVVQFLDRFGRNPREILRRYWELEERGITVVATDEDIKEELTLLIRAFMAGAESRKNSERVRANMVKAILKGSHAGNPPYGFQPVKELIDGKVKTTWAINEAEASIVREMFRLATEENLGYRSIADRLTQAGYRTRSGKLFASQNSKVLSARCATVLLHIDEEKYKHLTQQRIISSLDSCMKCSANSPYHFIEDAFSNHERNLNTNVIDDIFSQRLGIKGIWKRLARQSALASHLGSQNKDTIERIATEKLNGAIKHRNNIIHRGKSISHTGESEVRDTARFFSVLIDTLATVMYNHLQSL